MTRKMYRRADAVLKRTEFQGIEIHLDRPEGFVQQLDTPEGPKDRIYTCDYGFFPGTLDHDDEELDVFLGPAEDSDTVFVIRQNTHDGDFDEHKVMLGFEDEADAVEVYGEHIPPKLIDSVRELSLDEFTAEFLRNDMTAANRSAAFTGQHHILKGILDAIDSVSKEFSEGQAWEKSRPTSNHSILGGSFSHFTVIDPDDEFFEEPERNFRAVSRAAHDLLQKRLLPFKAAVESFEVSHFAPRDPEDVQFFIQVTLNRDMTASARVAARYLAAAKKPDLAANAAKDALIAKLIKVVDSVTADFEEGREEAEETTVPGVTARFKHNPIEDMDNDEIDSEIHHVSTGVERDIKLQLKSDMSKVSRVDVEYDEDGWYRIDVRLK